MIVVRWGWGGFLLSGSEKMGIMVVLGGILVCGSEEMGIEEK